MNEISFQGGYLLSKPTSRMWNIIQGELPKHKCIVENINGEGDNFFSIKKVYDKDMASLILRKNINFKFYPDIDLHTRINSYFPDEALKTLSEQTNVIETREQLRKYIKSIEPKKIVIKKYRWKPNDHIEKTYKALGLEQSEYITEITNFVTYIKDKKGNIIAKASPNNQRGVNFVYVYPQPQKYIMEAQRFALSQSGERENFGALQSINFFKEFNKNVRIDAGRIRPQKNN